MEMWVIGLQRINHVTTMNHSIVTCNEVEDQLDVSGIKNQQTCLVYHGGCKTSRMHMILIFSKLSFFVCLIYNPLVLLGQSHEAIFCITHFPIQQYHNDHKNSKQMPAWNTKDYVNLCTRSSALSRCIPKHIQWREQSTHTHNAEEWQMVHNMNRICG